MRPAAAEYLAYFDRYISTVPEADIVPVLAGQTALLQAVRDLPAERAGFRYAEGKWSAREALGHVIDTERVFGYRALAFARGETVSLPSFDQEPYAAHAGHDQCAWPELVDEFAALRASHVLMFRHLAPEAWTRVGRAGDHPMSVRAAAYILAGHFRYHMALLNERYGIPVGT